MLGLVLGTASAFGQITGTILGTVSDDQSIVRRGATTSVPSGEFSGGERVAVTDSSGQFSSLNVVRSDHKLSLRLPDPGTNRCEQSMFASRSLTIASGQNRCEIDEDCRRKQVCVRGICEEERPDPECGWECSWQCARYDWVDCQECWWVFGERHCVDTQCFECVDWERECEWVCY